MREQVRVEVAIEIISMCIAIAEDNNENDEIKKLNKEKEQIYLGNDKVVDMVINEYGKKVREKLEEKNG